MVSEDTRTDSNKRSQLYPWFDILQQNIDQPSTINLYYVLSSYRSLTSAFILSICLFEASLYTFSSLILLPIQALQPFSLSSFLYFVIRERMAVVTLYIYLSFPCLPWYLDFPWYVEDYREYFGQRGISNEMNLFSYIWYVVHCRSLKRRYVVIIVWGGVVVFNRVHWFNVIENYDDITNVEICILIVVSSPPSTIVLLQDRILHSIGQAVSQIHCQSFMISLKSLYPTNLAVDI